MRLTHTSRPIAPGARLTSFQRLQPDKWLRGNALSVKLGGGTGGTRADYLSSPGASTRKTVSEMAREHDPGKGRRTIAALNSDFFDIDETGAPLGPGLRGGRPTHSSGTGYNEAAGFGPRAAGRILDIYFKGTLTLPGGREPLAAYNAANVPENAIGAYNSQWGKADRALTTDGAPHTAEVTVRHGRVTHVTRLARDPGKPRTGAIPKDTTVLVGRDTGAKTLEKLRRGDKVSMAYHARTDDKSPLPRTAVGGRGLLVVDGKAQNWEGRPNNDTAPRTAVGFSKDGATMHVLTVDGRSTSSGGVTLTELARMMKESGAYNALNLDGGGSSTLLARDPGSATPRLRNTPSDGHEREVPEGLALTAPQGSGRLTGYWVRPAADPANAPTADTVPGGHPDRVFPGLTRKLTATGYDETYGPAERQGTPSWRSARPGVGRTDSSGVFHARHTGSTRVTAAHASPAPVSPARGATARGTAAGSAELTVVGGLDRIRPAKDRVALADGVSKGSFGILGFDSQGTSAPVDPADVRLDYDRSLFAVSPEPARGGFAVRARPGHESASGILTATVQGHTTKLALSVGLHDRQVTGFGNAQDWKFSAAQAKGSVEAEPHGRQGKGLRLNYDFSRSTATRAAYATPPEEIPVSGQPQSFRMWIKSDGKGAWPSLHLTDAAGDDQVLRGSHLDKKGWQRITFPVPEGVAYPLRVKRFYLAETEAGRQYAGSVVLDGLTAQTPPDVALPTTARTEDPLISTARDVAGRDWRFAVLSDAQLVAHDHSSPLLRRARRTLRQIRATRPDFLVIDGDLTGKGSAADLRFAHRLLRKELGDAVPWHYVPGDHEVTGGGIGGFRNEFGPAQGTFDHKGTRFITLDTSSLTLRGGGWGQITGLRRQLDAAGHDPRIGSVAVISHVPPRDPTGLGASRLTDRLEANLLEKWLSGFRTRTGKGAAFVGAHAGVFDASRVDGVPYLVNGYAGGTPSALPGRGGFTGWSLVGVDRGQGASRIPGTAGMAGIPGLPGGQTASEPSGSGSGDWLAVQTRPHVDGLTLNTPGTLRVGTTAKAKATALQRSGGRSGSGSGTDADMGAGTGTGTGTGAAAHKVSARKVPVRWPVSADWSGSGGLCVDKQHDGHDGGTGPRRGRGNGRCSAAYDPDSGTLTALRPGMVTLTVEVSGERARRQVRLTR